MENYHRSFLQQFNPLLKVYIDPDIYDSSAIQHIKRYLDLHDVSNKVWDNSIIKNRLSTNKYIIDISNKIELEKPEKHSHSRISPFNKESPLFPNGILSHEWFNKYVNEKPFQLIHISNYDNFTISEIKKLKMKLSSIGCKLTIILISSEKPNETNLNNIRIELDLPKLTGVVFLNDDESSLTRDSEVMINSLLSNLKSNSSEFYHSIEYRIKQRSRKYYTMPESMNQIDTAIELSPFFLETRNLIKQSVILQFANPQNLEPAITLLEISYQNLITALNGIPRGHLSQHDTKIVFQIRTLLDIVAFNIVRGYFSLEEPLRALKKHKTHIINVINCIGDPSLEENKNWISVQYEWLAQLMMIIPYSIITNLHTTFLSKQRKSNVLSYFGGVNLPEFDLITHPGLLYLKAFENSSDNEKRINMLNKSIDAFEVIKEDALQKASITGNDKLRSLVSYVYYLLGEEYYKREEFNEASDVYEFSFNLLERNWKHLLTPILERLLQCYEKINDKRGQLNTLLKLSTLKHSSNKHEMINEDLQIELVEDKTNRMFTVDVLLINNEGKAESNVMDDILFQMEIDPSVKVENFKAYFGDDAIVEITLSQIDVTFTRIDGKTSLPGLKNIKIQNDLDKNNVSFNELSENDGFLNLTMNNRKYIQFIQKATSAGLFEVDSVKIQAKITIKQNNHTIQMEKIEIHNDFKVGFIGNRKQYQNGKLIDKMIRLKNLTNTINVSPIKPNIVMKSTSTNPVYIPGERLSLPFDIEYRNKELQKKAILITEVKSNEDVISNWDNFKDDELINLLNITDHQHQLHIFSRRLTGNEILINFKVMTDEDDENVIYEVGSYQIPVMHNLFKCNYTISPRFRDNPKDMPSPFISSNVNHQMPIVVRLWQAQLTTSSSISIDIIDVDYTIASKNPEVVVDLESKQDNFNQLFTTRSKNGFSHRNVTLVNSAVIKWRRKEDSKDVINEYETDEWEFALALSDPRVLLRVANENYDNYKIDYILENPTPRIFNFTTQLIESEEWTWNDDRNVFPLSHQTPFPVLPFTQFFMTFHGKYKGTTNKVRLPQFRVFDIQYKVGLLSLPTQNEIIIKDKELYYVI